MFATYGGFRRRVAVLTVLSLVASVLVAAAPVSAADDPKPSYEAKFDACAGVSESGFTDVPAGHANAGDIDCIAYYGITRGTSATTYSPTSAVTREQMALFLTRLAGLVGITVPPAGGTDFTDIGDLSAESQAAISQLAQLEITQGTSDTTFSPSDGVRRDHMALFVQRLMNIMDSITDDDGHTPSDVVDNEDKADIGSPFTDLGLVTKSAYDAITELYELGVATGISGTAYGPSSLITRASMAGFMAAVLDHSNARPAGLSIQASTTSGWGQVDATVIVSYRDDSFMPIADQPIDVFNSEDPHALTSKGVCDSTKIVDGDCKWSDNDELTDDNGNIIDDGVSVADGGTNVFYAWIAIEDNATFDSDDADYVTASIASMKDEASIKLTTDLPAKASTAKLAENSDESIKYVEVDKPNDGRVVNLVDTSTVTITVQLQDDDGGDVARSGVELNVKTTLGADITSSAATLTTDGNGQATYTVTGPTNDKTVDKETRKDEIVFTHKTKAPVNGTVKIAWIEETRVTGKVDPSADKYVVVGTSQKATVNASLTFYDQYGKVYRKARGQKAQIAFEATMTTKTSPYVNVRHRGEARTSKGLEGLQPGTPIDVVYDPDPDESEEPGVPDDTVDIDVTDESVKGTKIQVVGSADSKSAAKGLEVHSLYADENKFTTKHIEDKKVTVNAGVLFSYDSNDTFIRDGSTISIEDFEGHLNPGDDNKQDAVVNVAVYSEDTTGTSIFEVTTSNQTS